MHTNGNAEKPLPRRVKVERGIYRNPRWETVVGGLREAHEERAKKVGAISHGERVAHPCSSTRRLLQAGEIEFVNPRRRRCRCAVRAARFVGGSRLPGENL
jgi:hypothetical protein